jgi:hypothetical protein
MATKILPFRAMGAHRRQITADAEQRKALLSPCLSATSAALESEPGVETYREQRMASLPTSHLRLCRTLNLHGTFY